MGYQILQGDSTTVLRDLPAKSVQTCMTSPPYFGLRDYGTGRWEGGDPDCSHKPPTEARAARPRSGLLGGLGYMESQEPVYREVCELCGARRADEQIGLEETPQAYVDKLVAVFAEVWRVLRDDGTLWLNLGDSYSGGQQTGRNDNGRTEYGKDLGWAEYDIPRTKLNRRDGAKPRDLLGIPWMVAFALRDFGWYLRSEIIWDKLNAMPESVTNRPTKSHETVFLLTKQPDYFFDATAVREKNSSRYLPWGNAHPGKGNVDSFTGGQRQSGLGEVPLERRMQLATSGRNIRSVWHIATPAFTLRRDLTPEQRAYVISELIKRGIL